MENGPPKALMGSHQVAADWFPQEALKRPGTLGLAAAGHVALIGSSQPQTLPAVVEIARLNPFPTLACVTIGILICFQASRLPVDRILLVGRMTLGLIAACLTLIAGDILNIISADQQPWASVIGGATCLVLLGGLTTLISDARAFFAR